MLMESSFSRTVDLIPAVLVKLDYFGIDSFWTNLIANLQINGLHNWQKFAKKTALIFFKAFQKAKKKKKNSKKTHCLGAFCLYTLLTRVWFLNSCSSDYVFLSGGDESKKYCGQKVPPAYVSKKNSIIMRFVSTSHPVNMKAGFVATYTSGSGPSDGKKLIMFVLS